MKRLGLTGILGASLSISTPAYSNIPTGEELFSSSYQYNSHEARSIISSYQDRFLNVIESICASHDNIQVTPSGYTFYPSVGFQFNTSLQQLKICNGGIPEEIGITDMKITECGIIGETQELICTLVDKGWGNTICVATSPDGEIRVGEGNCRLSNPPKN